MSRLARVSIPQALAYRGGQPMIAWLLHRIAGIGIVLFVGMHVFAGFILYAIPGGTANTIANALTSFYESRPVQVFVLFAVPLSWPQRAADRGARHVAQPAPLPSRSDVGAVGRVPADISDPGVSDCNWREGGLIRDT